MMEGRLYDAAIEGKVAVLLNLLNEDPLILDRCCISEGRFAASALHIAAERGHVEFSLQILNRKPELAEQLDSNKSSPLHLSSAKGRVEIVKALIIVSPDMCLARDLYGRNPFHLAAMKGQLDVLEELGRAMPQAGRERVNRNETVLHLCVKHDRLEALKLIVNSKIGDSEMLNARDDDGNSVLHKAVADKQLEVIKFLVKLDKIDKNALNTNGLTAKDIFVQSPKDPNNDKQIWKTIRHAKLLRGVDLRNRNTWEKHTNWLENQRSALMVVASLIATMAFQAGLNPPGGAWQESQPTDSNSEVSHTVGSSIIAKTYKLEYNIYVISSTVGMVTSMSIILLLISGLPCRGVMVRIMMVDMWIAITAMTTAYLTAIYVLTPKEDRNIAKYIIWVSSLIWFGLMVVLLLGHIVRCIIRTIKIGFRLMTKLWRCCSSCEIDRPPNV